MKVTVKKYDAAERPNLDSVTSTVLRHTARLRRTAKYTVVRNEHTGEVHHAALTIRSIELRKDRCSLDQKRSVTLEDGEIDGLLTLLRDARAGALPASPGTYVAAPADLREAAALSEIGRMSDQGSAEALLQLLRKTGQREGILGAVIEKLVEGDAEIIHDLGAAFSRIAYRRAVEDLREKVGSNEAKEYSFQALLMRNPWMFGSEYSDLIKERAITAREQQDFLFSRTADGYLEVVEIKTPLDGKGLFVLDASHRTYYPRAELTKAVAQVENYLEEIEADRNSILRRFKIDAKKVRAKLIIGRDGDEDQSDALRRMNGNFQRVEVITFDGLLRIAGRVLSYLDSSSP